MVVFGDLLYLQDAPQTYLEATKSLQEVVLRTYHPVTAGALGGGGQPLSRSPALHAESSPPFSLQTASLA